MKIVRCLFVVLLFASAVSSSAVCSDVLPLVPAPTKVALVTGKTFALPSMITVSMPDIPEWTAHVNFVGECINRMTGGQHRLKITNSDESVLGFFEDDFLPSEGYSLTVNDDGIYVEASGLKSLTRSTSTLLQLIGSATNAKLPHLQISDEASLSYRSFMVDMGRNAHSFELLKETVDLLWFYKVESLHLHLTDDQRFAFPSMAFPKLWDGLITVDQFKELEAYAVLRGVNIIPEFEVPGHSGKLCRLYPEVFGKNATELASTEAGLQGIQTVLDEMLDVFSSTPFIHIGGDEAFGVPEDLQRDLINKLHAYLKTKGRQTLVWEGPRPGKGANKVNEEVIHINWRTINYPADQMLKDGYSVVNAAWDPLYLVDHYPRTNFTMTSPEHIYNTLSLTRFKHVNPGISTFAKPIEVQPTKQLLGFCMPWWEGREENYLAQNVPRLIPFAEVAWNQERRRDYSGFANRAKISEASRKAAFYTVTIQATNLAVPSDGVFHDQTKISFQAQASTSANVEPEIRYTLNGAAPTATSKLYRKPVRVTASTIVRAAAFVDGIQQGYGSRKKLTAVSPVENLALGKPVSSSVTSGPPFSVQRLTDGGTGNLDFYLGYPAAIEHLKVTIDLEEIQSVSSVTVIAYTVSGSFEKYTVEVSVDGKTFEEVGSRLQKPEQPTASVEHTFAARDARFVRIVSHGNKGYVFDSFSKIVEVQVR